MSIGLLTAVEWSGTECAEESTLTPDWTKVETAIRALDATVRDQLILQPDEDDFDTWLAVGGGSGQLVVTGSKAGQSFPSFCMPGVPRTPRVLLQVGGQEGEYDNDMIVSLETALVVAHAFFDAGGFECGIAWSER